MSLVDTIKSVLGADPLERADADVHEVLDVLARLGPTPIETLDAASARRQPSIVDAAREVAGARRREPAFADIETKDVTYAGAAGNVPARLYLPATSDTSRRPAILYFHGGGWVIADVDTYDASARALAGLTGALVVSAHYRQAPEHPFPAAHDDALAAYRWLIDEAAVLNVDSARVVVAGESAGGNLAANVALEAPGRGLPAPVCQLLIYPVAGTSVSTLSYEENRSAKPLNKAMMSWFMEKALARPEDKDSPRLNLYDRDLHGAPPTILITAGIDPLRGDGEKLADALRAAGTFVDYRNYAGSTHEFFGLDNAIVSAREAQAFAANALQRYIGKPPEASVGTTTDSESMTDATAVTNSSQTPQTTADTPAGNRSTLDADTGTPGDTPLV
ncbi:alpha/beta hydrolase [Chitinasiproducens palmae]|uniref:Acetyl esterase/lipase n=1 Tax=Chitinasiproducens palmae TaxID=1770053 RepID=A0A1H2PIK7_9BURK|nr:alpha/beta hydrolase [Chitinasiproducens palmae]SDV46099.1 Acetyl esterase/lipase [Chitinasiproducens palmae]